MDLTCETLGLRRQSWKEAGKSYPRHLYLLYLFLDSASSNKLHNLIHLGCPMFLIHTRRSKVSNSSVPMVAKSATPASTLPTAGSAWHEKFPKNRMSAPEVGCWVWKWGSTLNVWPFEQEKGDVFPRNLEIDDLQANKPWFLLPNALLSSSESKPVQHGHAPLMGAHP